MIHFFENIDLYNPKLFRSNFPFWLTGFKNDRKYRNFFVFMFKNILRDLVTSIKQKQQFKLVM